MDDLNSTSQPETTWRDEAMNESLGGFNNAQNEDAFIHAVRRLQPALHTISLNVSRSRITEFFAQNCTPVANGLLTEHKVQSDGRSWHYLGWYKGVWESTPIEVALLPDGSYTSVALCDDAGILARFCETIHDFALRPRKRALRYSGGWEKARDLDEELGKVTWDDLTLAPELLQKIRESVETFFASQETVRSFGFAWKRGILLVGPPGTGKTMVCKAAATALPELPFLYVRDLRERNQKESIEAIFRRARKLAPCFLVFEDLDSLINEGNRTVFLNEMDGFASNEGLLIIASSNHPGKIDEALLRRPSRFDRVFHLGLPELAQRRAFCEKILTRESLSQKLAPGFDIAALCDQAAHKSEGFTPAYLKEAFVSAALSRAQSGATILDEQFAKTVLEQLAELKSHLKKTKNPDSLSEMRSGDDTIGFRR